MRARRIRLAIGLLGGLMFQLLMLSIYLAHNSFNGFFGQGTGEVFVSSDSPAAQRGYALPGEGTPAFLMQARPGLAQSLQYISIGIALLAVALLVAGFREERKGFLKFLGGVAGNLFLWAWVSLITGFFVIGIIAILPTTALWIALSILILVWLVIIWRLADNERIWYH